MPLPAAATQPLWQGKKMPLINPYPIVSSCSQAYPSSRNAAQCLPPDANGPACGAHPTHSTSGLPLLDTLRALGEEIAQRVLVVGFGQAWWRALVL